MKNQIIKEVLRNKEKQQKMKKYLKKEGKTENSKIIKQGDKIKI